MSPRARTDSQADRDRVHRHDGLHQALDFALGQRDEALRWFEDLSRRRLVEALFVPHDPSLQLLRADPAFRRVLEQYGPAAWARRGGAPAGPGSVQPS